MQTIGMRGGLWSLGLVGTLLFWTAGCGRNTGNNTSTRCVAGAQVACACPGGGSGVQGCRSDGTLGVCAGCPGSGSSSSASGTSSSAAGSTSALASSTVGSSQGGSTSLGGSSVMASSGVDSSSSVSLSSSADPSSSNVSSSSSMGPPPDTTITASPPAFTNLTTVQFEFTSNIAGATFECRVSSQGNTFAPCASPALFMALTQGAHTVDVRALAGGQTDATPATSTFTVDTTEPATVITGTPANATTTALAGCSYTFTTIPTMESPPVTFQCVLDGAMPFVPCTNTFTCPNLPTGTHALEVFATDGAGNVGMPAFVGWEIRPSNTTIPLVQMGTVAVNTLVRVTGRVTHVGSNRLWVQSAEAAFAGVTVVPTVAPNPATLTPGRFVTAVGVVAEVNGETQLINAEVFAGAQQAAFNALDTNRDAAVLLQEQHEGVLLNVGGTTLAGGCGDADFCIRSCARTVPLIPAVLAPGVTMTTINDDGIFEGVLEATSATTFQLRVTNAFDQNDACL